MVRKKPSIRELSHIYPTEGDTGASQVRDALIFVDNTKKRLPNGEAFLIRILRSLECVGRG